MRTFSHMKHQPVTKRNIGTANEEDWQATVAEPTKAGKIQWPSQRETLAKIVDAATAYTSLTLSEIQAMVNVEQSHFHNFASVIRLPVPPLNQCSFGCNLDPKYSVGAILNLMFSIIGLSLALRWCTAWARASEYSEICSVETSSVLFDVIFEWNNGSIFEPLFVMANIFGIVYKYVNTLTPPNRR